MTNMIYLQSTGHRRSAKLENKPKQKCDLFDKLSLESVGVCEVAKKSHIFLTKANQHIQKINRHFDENRNHFGPMLFVANQEKMNPIILSTCYRNQTSSILLYPLLNRSNHIKPEVIGHLLKRVRSTIS